VPAAEVIVITIDTRNMQEKVAIHAIEASTIVI
jgi:hypothetical protein